LRGFVRSALLLCLCSATTASAGDNPDLLFNCALAGQKRPMTLEGTRNILWDAGIAYLATVTPDSVDAIYVHQWNPDTRMRHHIVIGRRDGNLSFEVDEVSASGDLRNEMVRETGTCSPEKIHLRHFKDVDPKRLRY
jgi:hypothetical protein